MAQKAKAARLGSLLVFGIIAVLLFASCAELRMSPRQSSTAKPGSASSPLVDQVAAIPAQPSPTARTEAPGTSKQPTSTGDVTPEPPKPPARAAGEMQGNAYVLRRCLVAAIDDLDVASQEAGLLRDVEAREGMQVRRGTRLAQIDDSQHAAKLLALEAAHKRAQEKAKNDTHVRYAMAEDRVAEAEYNQALEANQRNANTFAVAEIRRRKLAWEKTTLGIEHAKFEKLMAQRDVEVTQAEMEQARIAVERCKVLAPWDAMVVEVKKRAGAWVTAGEPFVRLVRMDRVRVSGHVEAQQVGPRDIGGQAVRISAQMERGRGEQLNGRIVYANPVQNGGEFLVWAEIDNPRDGNQWMLRPGMEVEMSIDLQQVTTARR